jgi:hypothetical protein
VRGAILGGTMPEERAAPMLNAIEAFNETGVEAALPYLHPEIEWVAPPEWLEDRLYKGHDGIRRLSAYWTQLFDEYRVMPQQVMDAGEGRVVLLLQQEGAESSAAGTGSSPHSAISSRFATRSSRESRSSSPGKRRLRPPGYRTRTPLILNP